LTHAPPVRSSPGELSQPKLKSRKIKSKEKGGSEEPPFLTALIV